MNPLLYSTPDAFDYLSETNFPWLGPDVQSSDPFNYGVELSYGVELIRVPSLEEIIESWGPEAPAFVGSGLPAPLAVADAYGTSPTVEPVDPHYYFDQGTDPDSRAFLAN